MPGHDRHCSGVIMLNAVGSACQNCAAALPPPRPRTLSFAARDPHSPHRRLCAVHGEHGLDGDHHLPALDRAGPRRVAVGAQAGADVVPGKPRGVHSDQRLGCRSLRLAYGVHERDRRFHGWISAVRRVGYVDGICPESVPARHWRRHDGPRRAPGVDAGGAEERLHHRAQLPDDSGTAGSGDRPGARWGHHALFPLALHIPH